MIELLGATEGVLGWGFRFRGFFQVQSNRGSPRVVEGQGRKGDAEENDVGECPRGHT